MYGIITWGSTFSTHLHRIQILQNKAVRAVVGAHYHDSAKPILANLQILQIMIYLNLKLPSLYLNGTVIVHLSPSTFLKKRGMCRSV